MGKLIVIEGTDCSGKETQTNMIVKRLIDDNEKVIRFSFPRYDSPTGKIVGGPYLGKKEISDTWFDNPSHLDPKIASLYYAADRKYNIGEIEEYLNKGYIVFLDRYIPSNMAHQGGKLKTKEERIKIFKWLEKLEYDLLELPKQDITIFLHMPLECASKLKKNRELIDKHEEDLDHLKNAEDTYLQLAELYNYKTVECSINNEIRTIEDINDEIYKIIKEEI